MQLWVDGGRAGSLLVHDNGGGLGRHVRCCSRAQLQAGSSSGVPYVEAWMGAGRAGGEGWIRQSGMSDERRGWHSMSAQQPRSARRISGCHGGDDQGGAGQSFIVTSQPKG